MIRVKQINGLQAILDTYSTEWLDSVINILLTPPGGESTGDRYLVNWVGTATGAWTGKEGQIAEYNGSSWDFTDPTLGTSLSVDADPASIYRVTAVGGIVWTEYNLAQSLSDTLAIGNTSGQSDIILDAADSGDNAFTDSPKLILRGTYDSDPSASVTSTNWDADIVHNMLTAGASPTSQIDFGINSDVKLSLTSGGDMGLGIQTPTARFHIAGKGATSATTSFLVEDSAGVGFFRIRDDGSWSLGEGSSPATNTTVIIGSNITQTHNTSILIGNAVNEVSGTSRESIVIGNGATRTAVMAFGYAVVIGSSASATASGIAIGRTADAGAGIAIGNTAVDTGGGVTIGTNATSGSSFGVTLGNGATGGFRTVNVGALEASGQYNIAIGYSTTVTTINRGISIGYNTSNLVGAVTLGNLITTVGGNSNSLGLGNAADIAATSAVAVGHNTSVSGTEGVALGPGAESSAARAIAIGVASNPTSNKMTNSTTNSIGFGWEELTPSILFAKTANGYMDGSGDFSFYTRVSANKFSITPPQYNTGTASQSGNTVTGSGTTWTAAMVGSQFIYADGTNGGTITGFTNATSITVSTSQTVSSQNYSINYTGLQIDSSGRSGIGLTSLNAALHVRGSDELAGTNGLLVESLNGTTNFTVQNDGVVVYRSFTIAGGLPTAVAGGVIRISDESGGDTIAYSDGTNWRRVSDGAVAT